MVVLDFSFAIIIPYLSLILEVFNQIHLVYSQNSMSEREQNRNYQKNYATKSLLLSRPIFIFFFTPLVETDICQWEGEVNKFEILLNIYYNTYE